jgi:hypothetical protein
MGVKGVPKRYWAIGGAIAAVLVAIVLVVVFSGGGEEESPPDTTVNEPKKTAPQSQRSAYIAEVDPICRRHNRAIKRANFRMSEAADELRHGGAYKLVGGLAPYVKDLEQLTEESNAAFAAVEPPAGDKAVIDQLTELSGLQLQMTSALVEYSTARAPGQFRTASGKLKEIVLKREEIATEYGFEHCGRDDN